MVLKFPPLEDWQQPVYDEVIASRGKGKIIVVKSKRQVGKSLMAAVSLITYSMKWKGVSAIVEPTLAQSRRVFNQIKNMMDPTGLIQKANEQLLDIVFTNGSEILFKSAEQGTGLLGFTVSNLLVIDEAAYITSDIIDALMPTTDAHNSSILFISTPLFRDGTFYDFFTEGIKDDTGFYKSFDWAEYDTSKYLSKEKLEKYRLKVSPNKFRSDYLGLFIDDGSYIFGDINKCIKPLSNKPPKYGGIDWSNGGENNDYSVFILLDEYGDVTNVYSWRNLSPTELVTEIVKVLQQHPTLVKVQVELNSIGTVYYDMLKKAYSKNGIFVGFDTSNSSKRRIIEQLIAAFQQERIGIPNEFEFIRELQHYEMQKLKNGYTYNGADGVHDDFVMALAFAYDLIVNGSGTYSIGIVRNRKINRH